MTDTTRPSTPGLTGTALEEFLRYVHTVNGGGPLTAERRAELLAKLARAGQVAVRDEAAPAAAVARPEKRTAAARRTPAAPALAYEAPLPGLPYSTQALDRILIHRARRGPSLSAPLDKGTRRVLVWEVMGAPMDIETALHQAGW